MASMKPGTTVIRDTTLEGWPFNGPTGSFVGSARTATGWDVHFELPLEEESAVDDLAKPLWLVPAVDAFQRVTVRLTGGTFQEDVSGLGGDDADARPPEGWLIDDWHESDEGSLSITLILRESGTPELVLTAAPGGVIEVIVHEPESRPSSMSTDPDVVQFTFSKPIDAPMLPAGATWQRADPDEYTWELRRGTAAPEAFVGALRVLGELPEFLEAASGDERFDAESWLDYVTPRRRPF